MMKQKWYLLIICVMSCAEIWAQEDSPSWMIDNLTLTSVVDKADKVVSTGNIFNIPVDAEDVKTTFAFELKLTKQPDVEDVLPDKPEKIWYSWDGGSSTYSFEPVYTPKEGEENVWGVSVTLDLPIQDKGSDITFRFGISADKLEYPVNESVRVWSLPGAPSLSPQSYTTFTDKSYTFAVNEFKSIPEEFLPKYYVNGTDVTEKKIYEGNTSKDIGEQSYESTPLALGYSYSFGGKVWVDKTGDNAISDAASLITYHRPVYSCSIKVNNIKSEAQNTTVTHSDDVELVVERIKYGYGEDFTPSWSGKGQSYTAQNNGDVEIKEGSTVKLTNIISAGVEDSQEFEFNVTVLPEIKISNTIPQNSYSFIPEGDTKIAVNKIHNQVDLNWEWVWLLDNNELGGSDDSFDKNEITLSADKLKDAKAHELVAKVSCFNKNNVNKKYLDGETVIYNINIVSNPKVTSYGDFDNQDNITTCHNQKFRVTIETEGGFEGENAFHFALESDGGNYGHSEQTEGTQYDITYENSGNDVVESDISFSGVNIIPKEKSTTGAELSRKVEGTSKTFHATIYPYPQVQFTDSHINYFYSSTISKSIENKYPLPTTGNNWEFTWTFDDEIQDAFKDQYAIQIIAPDGGDAESKVHKLVVKGVNYYNGKKWGEQELPLSLTAWHRAQLDGIELKHEGTSNTNIYVGHTFHLAAVTQYGYPEGWKYTWKREDNDNTLSSKKSDEFQAEFLGSEGSEGQTYILYVENSISGLTEEPFKDNQTKDITVWRKAENYNPGADASYIKITDTQNGATINDRIREGRELKLEVPQAQYGYENKWTYTWNGTDTENYQSLLQVPNVQTTGEAMSKESKNISLKISNMGPNGVSWEENSISKSYTVYREPKTPTELKKKGNGATRTLIATMAISDQQLKDNDYYLCFGHRESNGNVTVIGESQKQEGAGQTRFMTQIPQDLWDDSDNLCVFALWHYDDGVWVSSGLRFINSAQEDWDGSDYIGGATYSGTTRSGNTTGIEDRKSILQDVKATYSLDGSVRSTMQRGLNIVRMADGTVHKIIKK